MAQGIPFRRVHRSDEERVTPIEKTPPTKPRAWEERSGWDIRNRFEEFAMVQAEKFREKIRPTPDTDSLPVTVIPAPPRRGAVLAQLLEEEELGSQRAAPHMVFDRRNSSASRTLPPGDESAPNSPTAGARPPLRAPALSISGWHETDAGGNGNGSSSTTRQLKLPSDETQRQQHP